MNNLAKMSGLDFELGKNKLIYDKEEYAPAVDWDKLFEAGNYAYKKPKSELETLYFGARYMEKTKDESIFVDNDFMADLTVINPGKVGDEFVKTVGHYHAHVENLDIAYPEVYEAVSGKFEYLLQSEPDKDGKVNVLWVITKPGDKVVMIPNYGHVSMNVGDQPATEVDIQIRDNPNYSDYSIFKENIGGAFYRTEKGLIPNPKYKVNFLRIVRPLEKPEWGLTNGVPLYTSVVKNPEKFGWLKRPQDFEFNLDELFEDIEL